MRLRHRAFRRWAALAALWASLACVPPGCGGSGGGSGGGSPSGGGGSPRIGRGVAAPIGAWTESTFRNGAGGYGGAAAYKTGSSAPSNLLETERLADGSLPKKTYLRFDLAGAFPAGSTVISASLVLTVYRENGAYGSPNDFLELRQLTQSWTGSGDRTYGAPPAAADGTVEVASMPDGSGGDPNVLTPPLPIEIPLTAALVQSWIDVPAGNNGIAVVPSAANDGLQLHFFSNQEATVAYRPLLQVRTTLDANLAPTASLTANIVSGPAPLSVTFSGSGSDPDGSIVAVRYDFDDGQVGTSPGATHSFVRPGTYFVNFSVADNLGKTATAIVAIRVTDPTTPGTYPSIGFHPPGGEPLASTQSVAPGLARPLPSSRRDVLVWHDQIDFAPGSQDAQGVFAGRTMVGSQKMPQSRIQVVRAANPLFRVLQYHLAYGLTRGGDWVDKNVFGPEKGKFDTWMASKGYGAAQTAGLIINSPRSTYLASSDSPTWGSLYDHALRYSAEFYYADPGYDPGGGSLWRRYIVDETLRRMQMNDAGYNFDGTFFDSSSEPGANLDAWCGLDAATWYQDSDVVSLPTNTQYADWWNARASAYYAAVRTAYSGASRYLVIPNTFTMTTTWCEPEYVSQTDGGFVESFGCSSSTASLAAAGPGEWERSFNRISARITGAGKVLLAVPWPDVGDIALRQFCVASFLLVKNDTSYYSLNAAGLPASPNGSGANPRWFPEFEIGIGSFLDDAPNSVDSLRVAGSSAGGLYARWYAGGLVLVNTSLTTSFAFPLDRTYYPVTFSGGGWVQLTGAKSAQSLSTGASVSGSFVVPPNSGRILRATP
jgi:PKD repeat protein